MFQIRRGPLYIKRQTKEPITVTVLSLKVEIVRSGDVNVDEELSWNSDTKSQEKQNEIVVHLIDEPILHHYQPKVEVWSPSTPFESSTPEP